ncbi:MAG: hypothetical protein R3275_02630 [Saprospiraceae bacterium]|nr:hypothetical protein [Saprospiraceae bacterium]
MKRIIMTSAHCFLPRRIKNEDFLFVIDSFDGENAIFQSDDPRG